jgi:DNA polymerase elongation subunit (family B)
MTAKILTFDVETSPVEAYVWGLWDQNIPIDFVKTDWTIFSYAAKWLHKKTVMYADTGGRGKDKVRDDKRLVRALRDLLDEADVVVAQNGKKFDVRKVNARMIEHGIAPPSPYKVIDTMLVSRKYFNFTSQKLKWTSERLTDAPKDDHKKYPGFALWKACLEDEPGAWKEMKKYNRQDVVSTEEVYLKLRPWIEHHPSVTLYKDEDAGNCTRCGADSSKLEKWGTKVLTQGVYQRYHCTVCGGMSRGKQDLRTLGVRRKQLVPA